MLFTTSQMQLIAICWTTLQRSYRSRREAFRVLWKSYLVMPDAPRIERQRLRRAHLRGMAMSFGSIGRYWGKLLRLWQRHLTNTLRKHERQNWKPKRLKL